MLLKVEADGGVDQEDVVHLITVARRVDSSASGKT
jgi:hypothetical protein